MPWTKRGRSSDTTSSPASVGRSEIAERSTVVPRSSGPTFAGSAGMRLSRPPLYGPPMYTGALSVTGDGPVPTVAVTVPARVSVGQLPLAASASGHSVTPATLPSSPGGREKRTPSRRWSRSGRVTVIASEPGSPPAAVLAALSLTVGVNGGLAGQAAPEPLKLVVNESWGLLTAPPLQGVSAATAVCDPQSAGLLRIAVGPPRNASANEVNGTCGRLSNTVVSCPVFGSGVASPGSLIFTPDCSMSTNSRSRWPGVGWPRKTLPLSVPSSGVTIDVVPICELAGQAAGAALPAPSWASVHAVAPSADLGESIVPCGSTTCARRTVELLFGTESVTV